jgi:hypothetical protein
MSKARLRQERRLLHVFRMLVVHGHLAAKDAFPWIKAKVWKDLHLQEARPIFTAESIDGTAFATDHRIGPFSKRYKQSEHCLPGTRHLHPDTIPALNHRGSCFRGF